MKKKIVLGVAALLFAGISTISFATNTTPPVKEAVDLSEGGGGGSECELCKIQSSKGKVRFSCRSTPDINNCSGNHLGFTLSCAGATECNN